MEGSKQEFRNGKFVVHKSSRQFSAIAIDQAHEQANAVIKGDGCAFGVTEDPSALRRWMIAGPEVSHWVAQYERACGTKARNEHTSHHEDTERAQSLFREKVEKLSQAIKDMGNPFQEETMELLSLDTKDVAHPAAVELISTHLEKGRKRFQEHLKGLEMGEESTLYDPIKKNQVDFFRQIPASILSSKQKVLKQDRELFSRLFVSCQSRRCDLTLLHHPCKMSESVEGGLHRPPFGSRKPRKLGQCAPGVW